jgi:uncharacterized membrane protein
MVRNLISVVSFIMAVIGALAVMLTGNRDRQTMGAIVGAAFLVSFLINVSREARLLLQGACLVAFAVAILGGIMTLFTNQEDKRTGGIITGIIALGTSLFILFYYVEFPQ